MAEQYIQKPGGEAVTLASTEYGTLQDAANVGFSPVAAPTIEAPKIDAPITPTIEPVTPGIVPTVQEEGQVFNKQQITDDITKTLAVSGVLDKTANQAFLDAAFRLSEGQNAPADLLGEGLTVGQAVERFNLGHLAPQMGLEPDEKLQEDVTKIEEKPQSILDQKKSIVDGFSTGIADLQKDERLTEAATAVTTAKTLAEEKRTTLEKTQADVELQDILNVETQVALKEKIAGGGRGIPMSEVNRELSRDMESLTTEQRMDRALDIYQLNTQINDFNSAQRSVQIAQGDYAAAQQNVQNTIDVWKEQQYLMLDILTEQGQLEREERAEAEKEIEFKEQLGLEGYTPITLEEKNQIIKEQGLDLVSAGQFFYERPNGEIYIKPQGGAGDQFTLSSGQTRFDAAGNVIAVGEAKPLSELEEINLELKRKELNELVDSGDLTKDQADQAQSLAKELKSDSAYGDMLDINTGMKGVISGLAEENGLGDIAAINAFQRMVDPGATVRSEDVVLVQSAASWLAKVAPSFQIEKLKEGDKLPSMVREQMVNLAKEIYEARRNGYTEATTPIKNRADALGIDFNKYVFRDFESVDQLTRPKNSQDYYDTLSDEEAQIFDDLQIEYNVDQETLYDMVYPKVSFSNVEGDTNTALPEEVAKADVGDDGGQCGRFVNNATGLGVGDSFQSKMAKMDDSITKPEPGMVFTIPYKDTGHCGFIIGIEGDDVIVKDSNWSLDEKVKTHKIPISKISGLARV